MESCLSGLEQGQNTKSEVTNLRENNIHDLSSSQDRIRRLSVRVCVDRSTIRIKILMGKWRQDITRAMLHLR